MTAKADPVVHWHRIFYGNAVIACEIMFDKGAVSSPYVEDVTCEACRRSTRFTSSGVA